MKLLRFPFWVVLALFLAGCGDTQDEDVRQWMVAERNQTQPKVQPLPEPKQFVPQPYQNASAVEPFSNQKLTQALMRDSSQAASNGALVAPELKRRREPLEAFALDSMTLVGSIAKAGRPVALVKVDNLLYQVRPGNYLGQNFGKVTKISETEVTLREIVQDPGGEWVERIVSLQLQERQQ
jgi:type IV pilus assembly protein PilP